MVFVALLVLLMLMMIMLVALAGVELPEENSCYYKGCCSPYTCPYWKKCNPVTRKRR